MDKVQLDKYLERINFRNKICNNLDTLSALQKSHLLNIPFENLDIHHKIPISINLEYFYNKIVENKRGGFCYELNGLFNELLKSLGFKTHLVSARVFNTQEKYGDEFDHLAIIVKIDNDNWIVDVGFGEFAFSPLKIITGIEQKDERGIFRIISFNKDYLAVQKKSSDGWKNEYLFSLRPRNISEFSDKCNYHQSSPDSTFTQKKLCSIATLNGRITLTDKSLKITSNDTVREIEIVNDKRFYQLLKIYFDIEFKADI
ncbi:MAG: arylamine N-acetyltransferase [Melioribacteraceae bacterium]|nr:MAG: arylamine N-acetyltransferase [Melioribacteraceae bacterium]